MKSRFGTLASTVAPLAAPLAAACGLALAASAAPAAAKTVSVDVAYADLDLTSPQGQSVLDRRIDSAARHICGDGRQRTGTRIVDNAKMRVCVAEVKARTASQVAAVKQERQLGG